MIIIKNYLISHEGQRVECIKIIAYPEGGNLYASYYEKDTNNISVGKIVKNNILGKKLDTCTVLTQIVKKRAELELHGCYLDVEEEKEKYIFYYSPYRKQYIKENKKIYEVVSNDEKLEVDNKNQIKILNKYLEYLLKYKKEYENDLI